MVSVIIAAHNEEAVIGACLDALLEQHNGASLEIIVSANGCRDRTAQVAAGRGVTVIERAEAGKPGALNAAETLATSFPRIYLDADIIVPPNAIDQMLGVLNRSHEALAVVPRRRVDTAGRPLSVRAYFAINERLPAFKDGLFGRGMILLTDAGRSRFDAFPSMIADDLFVDSLFSGVEKAVADAVEVVVGAPYQTRSLLRRLVRVRRGNAEMRCAASDSRTPFSIRSSDKWAWLREVVIPEPRLIFAAVPYVLITVIAGALARRGDAGWGRDESTRTSRADAWEWNPT